MPAKSEAQRRFAAMSASPKGRKAIKARGGKPMPAKAAKDFRQAPKGRKLPARKRSKR